MNDQSISVAVDEYLNNKSSSEKQTLKASVDLALGRNPDQEAQFLRLSQESGMPLETVRNMPDEAKRTVQFNQVNFDNLYHEFPKTANFLSAPEKAAISHDDIANLRDGEGVVKRYSGALAEGVVGQGLGSTLSGSSVLYDIFARQLAKPIIALGGDTAKDFLNTPIPDWANPSKVLLKNPGESLKAFGRDVGPKGAGRTFGTDVTSGLGQFAEQAILAWATGGLGSVVNLYAQGADQMQNNIAKDIANQDNKDAAVLGGAMVTAVTEKYALDTILGPLAVPIKNKIAAAAARIVIGGTAEGGQEITENIGQDILQKVLTNDKHEIGYGEAAYQGGVGATVGAMARSVVEAALHVKLRGLQQEQNAKRADALGNVLSEFNNVAEASKVRERDPGSAQSFFQSLLDEGNSNVYITPQALAESGLADKMAELIPSVGEQFATAQETGHDIEVPIADLMAHMAGPEIEQSILPHVSSEPGGYTFTSAQEYLQSDNAIQLEKDVEAAMNGALGDSEFKQSMEVVKNKLVAQLSNNSKFNATVNNKNATFAAAFYGTTAAKLGITPEELYNQFPLKVKGSQDQSAQRYDQGLKAPALNSVKALLEESDIDASIQESDGSITLSKLVVPQDQRSKGKGTAAMNVLIDYADKTGQRILLTPSFDFGGDVKRLKEFYKKLGFKENKGKSKDFSTREAMIREPKASAKFVPQTETKEFKKWSHGLPVVPFGEEHEFDDGGGVVVQAVHGTTADFDTFDQSKAKIEGDLGAGFYFTNNTDDVSANYAGEGPDLTHKLQILAERIASDTEREYDDPDVIEEARQQFIAHQGMAMPVFVRFDKPAVIGGVGGTLFEYEVNYDEETGEYSEPTGDLIDFVNALEEVANREQFMDVGINGAVDAIYEQALEHEGIFAEDIIKILSESEGLGYATDANTGDLAAKEIIRQTFEELGYDGFIDQTVNKKFGTERRQGQSMEGMDYGTVHFIAFNPTQIKSSIGNNGQFNENDANILRQGARGSFNPDTFDITMLPEADLSTFLHELGHAFLEIQIALASQINQKVLNGETLTPGEEKLLQDQAVLFNWFGIESLAEWHNLSFEEKRSYHEQFAEAIETYLFEGKAPSVELEGVFQSFRAWLVNVYRGLTAATMRVQLTPEVRQVMDRMLASSEQIQLAEQNRSMKPMFHNEAQAGMTPEEFAKYQMDATDGAQYGISELEAQGLKDLRWMANRKNKQLRILQREARNARNLMMIKAREQIMSQPVYRVWQFLTSKMDANDKLPKYEAEKVDPKQVNPQIDSLWVAISKFGGLDRAQVENEWGWDKGVKTPMIGFGKPLLRREGGLSLDSMAELLAADGYIDVNEHGQWDLTDFQDKFDAELRGDQQFSYAVDPRQFAEESRGGEGINIEEANIQAGRLALSDIRSIGLSKEVIEKLTELKMTAKEGFNPDILAEQFGFSSGDEMIKAIDAAETPKQAIEGLTDQLMLENFAGLSSPEDIALSADRAIHNDARAKFVATEVNALNKMLGKKAILAQAAKQFASNMISRLKLKDIKPRIYANAAARAGKEGQSASTKGEIERAAAEKRNQLINTYATRIAYDAKSEITAALKYFAKFKTDATRKAVDASFTDQIDRILTRFQLTNRPITRIADVQTLGKWINSMEDQGIEVQFADWLEDESIQGNYNDLTLEQFRDVVKAVKEVEYLGRQERKFQTAEGAAVLQVVVGETKESILEHSNGIVDNEKRNTMGSKAHHLFRNAMAVHRKMANLAFEMDGFKAGGPVWNYIVRTMNIQGDREASMRADATERLMNLSRDIRKTKLDGKGTFFPSMGRSFNRGEVLAMALNWGNSSNKQRLLGGHGWSEEQVLPVLQSLSSSDWQFVQGVWQFFESYRDQVAAKERRVYGKEPNWIEPSAFDIQTADGQTISISGGYYPVKYDPRQSGKAADFDEANAAKQQLRAAFTAATTRRSYTKGRVDEVVGRPLLLSFDGVWQGTNEVIHDLCWHEWLIDTNRLIRKLDPVMRNNYGYESVNVFKTAIKDTAVGDTPASNVFESGLNHIRTGSTIAGLGWNLTTSLLQPLGLSQTAVKVGAGWMAKGIKAFYTNPIEQATQIQAKSEFMRNRAATMNREINDVRNVIETSKSELRLSIEGSYFILIQKMQATVDYPTWLAGYEKAIAAGESENKAIHMADQTVLDSQGGGQMKDLAQVQRGHPALKLFTTFYSYFNTTLNLAIDRTHATDFRKPGDIASLAGDYLLLFSLPAVLSVLMKEALSHLFGGDDKDWDWDKVNKKIVEEQIGTLFNLFVGVREFTLAGQTLLGVGNPGLGYQGPGGARLIAEIQKLAKQMNQGEWDAALRHTAINVVGMSLHLPSGAANRFVDGALDLIDKGSANVGRLLTGPARKY